MRIYGYIRVSTKEQRIDRQINALQEVGVTQKQIYTDMVSGKNFDRPAYKRLIKKLNRPARQKCRRSSGAVESYHKSNLCRYCCSGYAPFGYQTGKGSDGGTYF